MSRVERTENPSERRQSERRVANRRTGASGRTPGKAEGEEKDVEEALKSQQE